MNLGVGPKCCCFSACHAGVALFVFETDRAPLSTFNVFGSCEEHCLPRFPHPDDLHCTRKPDLTEMADGIGHATPFFTSDMDEQPFSTVFPLASSSRSAGLSYFSFQSRALATLATLA